MFKNRFSKAVCFSFIVLINTFALAACGGSGSSGEGDSSGDGDTIAPTAAITFPTQNALTEGDTVTVHGTASDAESDITVVRVNGVDATSGDNFATWQAVVPLSPGTNILQVETSDMALNSNSNAAQVVVVRGAVLANLRAMVLDSDNNRALVVSRGMVMAVDLSSGVSSVISGNSIQDDPTTFITPTRLVLDSDKSKNRVLVLDSGLGALLAVDLATGVRTIISDSSHPDSINAFTVPTDLVLDSDNDRVLVVDSGLKAVLAVDLSDGTRTIISNNSTPQAVGNTFDRPVILVLDKNKARVLVVDRDLKAILAVDLTTGERTIISDNSMSTPNPFSSPESLVLDSGNDRLLVANRREILSVALTGGERTVFPIEFPVADRSLLPSALVLDSINNRLLVAGRGRSAVFAVNLTTKIPTRLSLASHTQDTRRIRPLSLALDSSRNQVLVLNTIGNVIAVNLSSGVRTVISDWGTPDVKNIFLGATDMVLDPDSEVPRLLVTDRSRRALMAVDLATGARTIISDRDTPNGGDLFADPRAVAIDSVNGRALVVDVARARGGWSSVFYAVDLTSGVRTIISDENALGATDTSNIPQGVVLDKSESGDRLLVVYGRQGGVGSVLAVALSDGARTVISDSSVPLAGINALSDPQDLVLDNANERILVVDKGLAAVLAVNLETGERSIISDNYTLGNINSFDQPTSLMLDSTSNRLLVGDFGLNAVIAVQLDSGERVILSR